MWTTPAAGNSPNPPSVTQAEAPAERFVRLAQAALAPPATRACIATPARAPVAVARVPAHLRRLPAKPRPAASSLPWS
jgi:hypothetical protein